ncbi:MAG: 30S ribosomal protein S12 methylthiotransferase RimO [Chloroflexi bacterium]|nr:30S ribosomal protein S12 methylthiotransferase RimO [Chloroflexota bacterium]
MKIHLTSLGCPKNNVDAERMLELLRRAGHRIVQDPRRADCLIVNTCGFLATARAESLQALSELAAQRRPGQRIVAAGCLPQMAGQALFGQAPGVDGLLGTLRWHEAPAFLQELQRQPRLAWLGAGASSGEDVPGPRDPAGASAYLKIADGCSAACAFCTIPRIKGPYRSRPTSVVVREAQDLAAQGVKELVLVAQDTTAYGRDRGEVDGLPTLLEAILAAVPELPWLRLMYAYPGRVSDRLIDLMAGQAQVCRYLDLPLQHADPEVLRRMGRPANVRAVRGLIGRLRAAMPDVALRTTFIVGYPGESQAAFDALLRFVEEMSFDHVGAFPFSAEPGTVAAALPDHVPPALQEERYAALMELQQGISLRRHQALVGQTLPVLTEGAGEELTLARSRRDAPEIDGWVLLPGRWPLGEIRQVRITQALPYDLWGETVGAVPDRRG